jgi:CheY-like chemotaxis protein
MEKVKVLLIEQSEFLRIAAERALLRAGYAVTPVSNGEQALQAAREGAFNLILLDLLQLGTPGLAVLQTLKMDEATAHIPVIIVNGLAISKLFSSQPSSFCKNGLLNTMSQIARTIQEESLDKSGNRQSQMH